MNTARTILILSLFILSSCGSMGGGCPVNISTQVYVSDGEILVPFGAPTSETVNATLVQPEAEEGKVVPSSYWQLNAGKLAKALANIESDVQKKNGNLLKVFGPGMAFEVEFPGDFPSDMDSLPGRKTKECPNNGAGWTFDVQIVLKSGSGGVQQVGLSDGKVYFTHPLITELWIDSTVFSGILESGRVNSSVLIKRVDTSQVDVDQRVANAFLTDSVLVARGVSVGATMEEREDISSLLDALATFQPSGTQLVVYLAWNGNTASGAVFREPMPAPTPYPTITPVVVQ